MERSESFRAAPSGSQRQLLTVSRQTTIKSMLESRIGRCKVRMKRCMPVEDKHN